jgi:Flp pilus assembly protein TadG
MIESAGSRTAGTSRPRKLRNRIAARLRAEEGQAMPELALGICVLLVVVLGIIDFGKAINYWNDDNHLANLGARMAAVGSTGSTCGGTDYSTSGTLAGYIRCEAGLDSGELTSGGGGNGVQNGGACVQVSASSAAVGQPVTVTVSEQYKWLPVPMLGGFGNLGTTSVSGTATMRLEQAPPSGVVSSAGC